MTIDLGSAARIVGRMREERLVTALAAAPCDLKPEARSLHRTPGTTLTEPPPSPWQRRSSGATVRLDNDLSPLDPAV